MSEYQVIWRGIVHDSSGYARASRGYALALDELGVDVVIEPLGTASAGALAHHSPRLAALTRKPHATEKKRLTYHSPPTNGV